MSVAIDDSDPVVVYSSGWRKAGAPEEYDQTTSVANQAGMTAKLNFQGGYGHGRSLYIHFDGGL